MTPSDEFRKNAEHCRKRASETNDAGYKAEWLKLADEWARMAEAAHSRPDAFDAVEDDA